MQVVGYVNKTAGFLRPFIENNSFIGHGSILHRFYVTNCILFVGMHIIDYFVIDETPQYTKRINR